METIIPGVLMKERKDSTRRKTKQRHHLPTARMQETQKLVARGFSIKEAMRQAGYSETTISNRWRDYVDKLDLRELVDGLKKGTAILHYEILKVLSEELKNEDVKERLRAADIGVRMGKVHLNDQEQIAPKIVFHFQTVQGKSVEIIQARNKSREDVVDIGSDDLCIDGELED